MTRVAPWMTAANLDFDRKARAIARARKARALKQQPAREALMLVQELTRLGTGGEIVHEQYAALETVAYGEQTATKRQIAKLASAAVQIVETAVRTVYTDPEWTARAHFEARLAECEREELAHLGADTAAALRALDALA